MNLHVVGTDAATSERLDLWIADGVFVEGPLSDAIEFCGFVLPGFVDAHCHIGFSAQGAVSLAEAARQARTDLLTGVLAIRDCGSPIDTRPLVGRADLPVLIRAGRHLARPKRYVRELGLDIEDPADLPAEVARQAEYGGGWIKIVGDWIDRDLGDLAPLWPDDVLVEAIGVAHAHGARVTSHVFSEDALPGLLAAGIDCIEHGTGLTDDTIAQMVSGDVHLVPTMINIVNFPMFAQAAHRFPAYAKHMIDLFERSDQTFAAAVAAGVKIHAGTDAGGYVEHGRIVDEVLAMERIKMGPADILRSTSHDSRAWLGLGSYALGDDGDLVVYSGDPAVDLNILRQPMAVIRAGVVAE